MIRISAAQMAASRRFALTRYEQRTAALIGEFFEPSHARMGGHHVLAVVRLAIERAARHGFSNQIEIWRYISVMMRHGSYFDEDPQLPWAREVLTDRAIAGPLSRVLALYGQGIEHYERLHGEAGERWRSAALVLRRAASEGFIIRADLDLQQELLATLELMHVGKFDAVGEQGVADLIRAAAVVGQSHGLTRPQSIAACAALSFTLGSHFHADPQHPQVQLALSSEADEATKRRELIIAGIASLDDRLPPAEAKAPGIKEPRLEAGVA